jgi:hypothetical protein
MGHSLVLMKIVGKKLGTAATQLTAVLGPDPPVRGSDSAAWKSSARSVIIALRAVNWPSRHWTERVAPVRK